MDRKNQQNNFFKFSLTSINSITLITQAIHDNQIITKSYVDQIHQATEHSRRDLGIDFYNVSSDLVKKSYEDKSFNDFKLTNLDSFTVNRNPTTNNEFSNERYFDNELD